MQRLLKTLLSTTILAALPITFALADSTPGNLGVATTSLSGGKLPFDQGPGTDTALGFDTSVFDVAAGLLTTKSGGLPISKGGTGGTTAPSAAHNLGLGTSDSPTFTGLTLSGIPTCNDGAHALGTTAGVLSCSVISAYTAPTLGSTPIPSGATVGTIAGLTLSALTGTGTTTLTGTVIIQNAASNGLLLENAASSASGVYIYPSGVDGVLQLADHTGSGFSRLVFGATSVSGISIKKNGTAFNFRLGDDSADAVITAGTATFSGNTTFGALSILKGYTVDTLPTGVTGGQAYVTDAVACTFLATPVHNGAVTCPVFYNGTAWVGG